VQEQKVFAEERQERILEILIKENRICVSELADLLNVTDATIRRDLKYLESQEKLFRTHGGALYRDEPVFWQTTFIESRKQENPEAKRMIARYIATFIKDHESLLIDGGSTNMLVAEELARVRKNLMVVTNYQKIGEIIANGAGENRAIIIGGELMAQTQNTVGPIAENMIKSFRLDKALIGATSVMPGHGCYSANPQEGEIKRQMIAQSSESYVVVDSSKIGKYALYEFSDFRDIDAVITDSNVGGRSREQFAENQVELKIAE
jgi:DeoR family transcriptional regulator, fructose operon transcriptional repressor